MHVHTQHICTTHTHDIYSILIDNYIICLECAIISFHHHRPMHTSYTHKRTIQVTLDLEVYEDFDLRDVDFSELLSLEGDESVDVSINDYSEVEV